MCPKPEKSFREKNRIPLFIHVFVSIPACRSPIFLSAQNAFFGLAAPPNSPPAYRPNLLNLFLLEMLTRPGGGFFKCDYYRNSRVSPGILPHKDCRRVYAFPSPYAVNRCLRQYFRTSTREYIPRNLSGSITARYGAVEMVPQRGSISVGVE